MQSNLVIHSTFSEIDSEKWHELVNQSPFASIFQSREMYLFWEQQKEHDPFVVAISENNRLVALCSGVIMYSGRGVKKGLTQRAIISGGPLLSEVTDITSILKVLLQTTDQLLKSKAIYAEIRNLLDYSEYARVFTEAGWNYKPHLNFHLDSSNEEEAISRLNKDKKRQINKSLKEGAKIIEATHSKQVQDFYEILQNLYKTRVKTPLPDFSFFQSFFESQLGKYFLIEYEGKIVGGIMCPILSHKVIYNWYVCGMDRELKKVHPSILATWSAIKYGFDNGIPVFDFMGAGAPDKDYGVRDFKAQFGGVLVEHGRFYKVYQPILYKLGEQAVKVLKGKK